MKDLIFSSDPTGHTPVSGVRLYWNAPGLGNKALLFSFDVSTDSPYVPKNGTSPAPKLFADVHMRRAFAYALNFTQSIDDYTSSSGYDPGLVQRASWWLRGMKPDYEDKTLIPRDMNSTRIEEELKAAGVWEQGFETAIVYQAGSDLTSTLVIERNIAAVFANMNPKFNVSIVGIGVSEWLDYQEKHSMPIFAMIWSADFADPEDLARTYMHSTGKIASLQKYNDTRVDYLVDLGLSQPDGPERNATYQELQGIYWRDIPSLPLYQYVSRKWSREWVRGWYFNALYSGSYYYDLYKDSSTPNGSGGQVFDYSIPIIAIGTIIIAITVSSVIYAGHRKKEFPPPKEESKSTRQREEIRPKRAR